MTWLWIAAWGVLLVVFIGLLLADTSRTVDRLANPDEPVAGVADLLTRDDPDDEGGESRGDRRRGALGAWGWPGGMGGLVGHAILCDPTVPVEADDVIQAARLKNGFRVIGCRRYL
jgi:hypothetical protein